MEIRPLTADDADLLPGVVEVRNAAAAEDAPHRPPATVTRLEAELRWGWEQDPSEHVVGLEDGAVVAEGAAHYNEFDNLDLAWLSVTVHPARRRAGLGTQLLQHLVGLAEARGCTKLGGDGWDGSPARDFAAHHGFTVGSTAINRRQHLDRLDLTMVRKLHDDAADAAAAYELVRIEGATPADLRPAVAEMAAAINDAPLDDLDIEDEVFSAERLARYEEAQLRGGHRLYRLLARERATGALAGHTVVAVEVDRPELGWQHDTSVVRDHRGHRLGLLLKAAMVLWLADAEPGLGTVDTWNAESNDHMIGVNETLGYEWTARGIQFQRPLRV